MGLLSGTTSSLSLDDNIVPLPPPPNKDTHFSCGLSATTLERLRFIRRFRQRVECVPIFSS